MSYKTPETVLKAQAGDHEALESVIESLSRVIEREANRVGDTHSQRDDRIQAGRLGVIKALHGYDPAKGPLTIAYVKSFVRWEVLEAVRESRPGFDIPSRSAARYLAAKRSTESIHEARERCEEFDLTKATFDDVHNAFTAVHSVEHLSNGSDDGDDETIAFDIPAGDDFAEVYVERKALKAKVAAALEALEDRDREVLVLAMGLNGGEPMNDGQIAEVLGIDRTRINRIRNRAIGVVRVFFTETEEV